MKKSFGDILKISDDDSAVAEVKKNKDLFNKVKSVAEGLVSKFQSEKVGHDFDTTEICELCDMPECCAQKVKNLSGEYIQFLSKKINKKGEEFCIKSEAGYELIQKDMSCIFLDNKKCMIHEIKPNSCKSYVFCRPIKVCLRLLGLDSFEINEMRMNYSLNLEKNLDGEFKSSVE